MPILRRESDIFPADLFASTDVPWEILHVRSRQEKVVARRLRERWQPFYLPQVEQRVRRGGRNFVSFLPLFPGYVFVRGDRELREALWSLNAVVRRIAVRDQVLLSTELAQIRRLQESGAILIPRPDLTVGDAVRVTEGVFAGYVGTVVRERGTLRLVVAISALSKAITAEVSRESLVRTASV
jgi:transcription antitermination factor NusG